MLMLLHSFYVKLFWPFHGEIMPHFFFLQDDYLVSKPVKQHLAKYDKQLKKFNVSMALDTALQVHFIYS